MRVLFLSRWFPFPPDNGSKLRVFNLLRGISQQHEISLLSFVENAEDGASAHELRSLCGDIQTVIRKPFEPNSRRALAGFFSSAPRSVIDTYSPEMARRIRGALQDRSFDLVIASQEGTAAYGNLFEGRPALFEEVEIAVLYERYVKATHLWPRFRHRLTWAKQRRFLGRLFENFAACTVVSNQEQALLKKTIPWCPPVEVVPNCVNLDDYQGFERAPEPNQLIFTGSFRYFPNHEAMVWFLNEVFPMVRRQVPGVRLMITGDHAGLPIPEMENVNRTGHLPDVRPAIAGAWASLAPIHRGGGTRLKILESMALGTPVIATSKGAEGLEYRPGSHLLMADSAKDFAAATVRLLKDSELRADLSRQALSLVRERYHWPGMMPRFLELISNMTGRAESQKKGRSSSRHA